MSQRTNVLVKSDLQSVVHLKKMLESNWGEKYVGKDLLVPEEYCNNRGYRRQREAIRTTFERHGRYLESVIASEANDGKRHFDWRFENERPKTIWYRGGREGNWDVDLGSDVETLMETGFDDYAISARMDLLRKKKPGLIPLESIAEVSNGGGHIRKAIPGKANSDVGYGACITASFVSDNPFVFREMAIENYAVKGHPLPKDERTMLLVAAAGYQQVDIGVSSLIWSRADTLYAANSVHVVKLKPEISRQHALAIHKYMLTPDFATQLFLKGRKRPTISVGNLRKALVPGTSDMSADEYGVVRGEIETLEALTKDMSGIKERLRTKLEEVKRRGFSRLANPWLIRMESQAERYPE